MSELRDEQLAALLEARADRVPPRVGHEVLAAVVEEIRGPTGGGAFAVLPVLTGARGGEGSGQRLVVVALSGPPIAHVVLP